MTIIIYSKVYELINNILNKHSISIEIKPYEDLQIIEKEGIIKWNIPIGKGLEHNKISEYLEQQIFKTVEVSEKIFYHYLPKYEYLENIFKSGKIRLNSLNKYRNSDDTEYSQFFKDFGISFSKYEKQFASIKDNNFIWCLTDTINSERHWNIYADNGRGVAIGVKYSLLFKERNIIEFVQVCYDLPFMRELQKELHTHFGLKLDIRGYSYFAKFYKKKCFDWEQEYRLSFDNNQKIVKDKIDDFVNYNNPQKKNLDNCFTVQPGKNCKYILIPLNNPFFTLKITDVFCIDDKQMGNAKIYQESYGFKLHKSTKQQGRKP